MLSDPQLINNNGGTASLPRVQTNPTQSVYQSADGATVMTVKQNQTKARFRREVRLSQSKVAADALTGSNSLIGFSVYLVIDEPRAGYSDAEIKNMIKALKDALTDNFQDRILGGEH